MKPSFVPRSCILRLLRSCALSLLLFSQQSISAHAQEEAQPAGEVAEKVTGRKAWFMCTDIPNDLPNPVSVLVQEKIHEVTLSIRHMSDVFPVRGDGTVRIVREVPNPAKPDTLMYEALAQAKVPDNVEKALIILVPSQKKAGSGLIFSSKVLDLQSFRGGDYLYLNLSPRKIGITLGANRHVLQPGELKIQDNREIQSATNQVLSLRYQAPGNDTWKLIVATTVVVQPTRREICVFHWDEKSQRIDYRGATFPVEIE